MSKILIRHKNQNFYVSKEYLLSALAAIKKDKLIIFKEETCVICLENEPDSYFVPCGHLCVHRCCHQQHERRCYLCRKPILDIRSV